MAPTLYPNKPCLECGKPSLGRNLCPTHYNAVWRSENAERYTHTCANCGEEFKTWRKKMGYCKPTCQRRAAKNSTSRSYALEPYTAPEAEVPTVTGGYWTAGRCATCATLFVSRYMDNTCSPECRASHLRLRLQNKGHRRRARIRGSNPGRVDISAVFKRDQFTCQLCMKPVEMTARVPEHRAPTLDHVLPIARGGSHTEDNAQLAHFICNARKSDNLRLAQHFINMM